VPWWDSAPQAHSRVSNINFDIWIWVISATAKFQLTLAPTLSGLNKLKHFLALSLLITLSHPNPKPTIKTKKMHPIQTLPSAKHRHFL
jgi:hypothetical protein